MKVTMMHNQHQRDDLFDDRSMIARCSGVVAKSALIKHGAGALKVLNISGAGTVPAFHFQPEQIAGRH
jgi:hypothetical protein